MAANRITRQMEITKHENFDAQEFDNSYARDRFSKNSCEAIGYLASWAIAGASGNYAGKMSLYGDADGGWHATYRNEQGEVTYTIFGELSEDGEYSFHS